MGRRSIWIRLYTYFIGPGRLFLRPILAAYLAATFAGSQDLSHLEPSPPRFETPPALGFARLLWPAAAADRRPSLGDEQQSSRPSRRRAVRRRDRLSHARCWWTAGRQAIPIAPDAPTRSTSWAASWDRCWRDSFCCRSFGEQKSSMLFSLPWFAMAMPWSAQTPQPAADSLAAAAAISSRRAGRVLLHRGLRGRLSRPRGAARQHRHRRSPPAPAWTRCSWSTALGMTSLTPITKMMAHFTLAPLPRAAAQCADHLLRHGHHVSLGDVLEHSRHRRRAGAQRAQAVHLLSSRWRTGCSLRPCAHVVIDDGRRYPGAHRRRSMTPSSSIRRRRCRPPVPACCTRATSTSWSSNALRPGGILQQWLPPEGDAADQAAIARALDRRLPLRSRLSAPSLA